MRKLLKINKVLLALLICTPLSLHGQVSLRGRVLKLSDKKPVFAANVFLKNHRDVGTATDPNGNFSLKITNEQRGDSLVVSSVGFKRKVISLSNLRWDEVNVFKLENDVTSLKEVTVNAGPTLAEEFSTKKLNRISIYMSPVSGADPLKAITLLPSSTNTSENANPELRGSSGDYSRVVLNGVPLYKPVRNAQLNGLGNFSILNTELIEYEDVYGGNPPLTYGSSIAGLIDIETRNSLDDKQVKVAASLANIGFLYGTPLADRKTFIQVFGNVQSSEAYRQVNAGNTPYIKHFDSQDGGINFRYSMSDHISANSYAYFINEEYRANNLLYNYTGQMEAGKRRFFNVLNLKYINNNTVITLNNEFNLINSGYTFGNIDTDIDESQIYNALDVKYFLSDYVSLQMGASDDYFNDHFTNTLPFYYYAISPTDSTYSFSHRKDNHNLESYGYARYTGDNMVFGAGFRKNIPVDSQEDYLSYQGNIRYNFTSKSSALLSAGRYNGYTVPAYYIQRFAHISSVQYAVEYNYDSNNTDIGLALYSKSEDGPRYFDETGSTVSTKQNIQGVEVSWKQQISRFQLQSSYTWLNSHFEGPNEEHNFPNYNDLDYLIKLALSYSNRHILNASVSFITRPGHHYTPVIDSEIVDEGPKPIYGNFNAKQLGGYSTLDITLNKLISWNDALIVPFFTLTNILDRKNKNIPVYSKNYGNIIGNRHYQERVVYFGVQVSFNNW